MSKIVIDPITRIEGHLRIEAEIADGKVTNADSAGTMFRGLEKILINRDPREAWMFAQRICGVCTTVHAICSVRAVEDALALTIPDNARLIRNIVCATQYIHDHVIHFYHLHGPDWFDVVSALSADPAKAATLQQMLSPWPNNTTAYFHTVKDRLASVVNSGQLGLFANGYWGHPGYQLPPEANLLMVAHYLEALNFQRDFVQIHAYFGGHNPHIQTYAVGGMANPLSATGGYTINLTTLNTIRDLAVQALNFVSQVYYPDMKLLKQFYGQWLRIGAGCRNMLAVGEFPQSNSDPVGSLYLPRGVVWNSNLLSPPLPLDTAKIVEDIKHSWYSYTAGDNVSLHPAVGETTPNYTGPTPPYDYLDTSSKYSWLKAPRYDGKVVEVGPLARVAVAYAAGHARIRSLVNGLFTYTDRPTHGLFSTLGRIMARAVETQVLAEELPGWIDQLRANLSAGNTSAIDTSKWYPSTWGTNRSGWGATEAPRGALAHWVKFDGGSTGKITAYQCVVPTTWNASPRDKSSVPGPLEQALVGTPIVDPALPLEILRTVHSFDPCMACAVHIINPVHADAIQVTTQHAPAVT